MQSEIDSIQKKKTWLIVELPAGKTPITAKWIYKIKTKNDG